MKLDPKRSEASMDGDDWLATMRSAWRSGIERDERDEQAASARRLARVVTPEAREAR